MVAVVFVREPFAIFEDYWSAATVPENILDAKIGAAADLILCSHVFYYIDTAEGLPNLERLASWLSLPMPDPPARDALEDYVRARFESLNGSFEFSAITSLSRSGDAVDEDICLSHHRGGWRPMAGCWSGLFRRAPAQNTISFTGVWSSHNRPPICLLRVHLCSIPEIGVSSPLQPSTNSATPLLL
jgi:hypothetical protein